MNWELTKQRARVVFARAAELVVFLQLIFYLLACAIAAKPVGPKEYVRFAYYCVDWTAARAPAASVADGEQQ